MRIQLKRLQTQSRSIPVSRATPGFRDAVTLEDLVSDVLNDVTSGAPRLVALPSIPLLLAALGGLTKLEFVKSSPYDTISVPGVFSVLRHMPRLQDLTLDVNQMQPAAQGTPLPPLPTSLRLRRFVLSQAFPDWALLICHSRDTLKRLALGLRWRGLEYSSPLLMGDVPLAVLQNVRALRMDEQPDAAVLAACAPTLEALTLHGIESDLALLQLCHVLRSQLRRLRVLYSYFTAARAAVLARALAAMPVYSGLRVLDIEADIGLAVDERESRARARARSWRSCALRDISRCRCLLHVLLWTGNVWKADACTDNAYRVFRVVHLSRAKRTSSVSSRLLARDREYTVFL